jgi:PAS domain S-box-containing protein
MPPKPPTHLQPSEPRRPASQRSKRRLRKLEETPRSNKTSDIKARRDSIRHELEVHRVELEMQNQELRDARLQIERALERYRDLYDFAPVGYLTLDSSGVILEANLTACSLFGIGRVRLYQRLLPMLVPVQERAAVRLHLRETFRSPAKQRCEVRLRRRDDQREIWISLESLRDDKSPGEWRCRTMISDVTERKEAQLALLQTHCDLEHRVEERTRELADANSALESHLEARGRAETALRMSRADLRTLASEAALAEQRERQHLASDLHDGLSQLLALARIKLEAIGHSDAGRNGASDAVREVRNLLAQAQQHAESLTFQLCPPLLRDVGLVAAAERLAEDVERTYGVPVAVHSPREHRLDDDAVGVTVFRALRELVLNAAKHACAKRVTVRFGTRDDRVFIDVADDGSGFDVESVRAGFGLSNVRERMTYLGGSFEIRSERSGTQARLILPPARARPRHSAVTER